MAIKFSSLKTSGVSIPNANKYTNISGGWDSAPVNGGIIVFNGKASEVTDQSPITQPTLSLGSLGSFYITSTTTDTYLGYKKNNYNFTCILGYLSKTNASIPLGSCVYKDSTLNDVLSSIKNYLGISFSLPRGDALKIHEPLWLKEDQSLVSLLNEIMTATGCILYAEKGTIVKCKTISDFYNGLSGQSNDNTISKNFTIDRGGTAIKYIDISGTKQVYEDLPSKEDSTVTTQNGKKIITTIERTLPQQLSSGGTRKIITTIENNETGVKTVTTEKFEDAPKYNSSNNRSAPIKDCFPYDPARILERKVETYLKNNFNKQRVVNSCVKEYCNSCNIDEKDKPLFFYSSPTWVLVEEVLETWVYDTKEDTIVDNPDNYVPERETVTYTKEIKKNTAYENTSHCNVTYGNTFDFLENTDDAKDFAQTFWSKKAVDNFMGLNIIEKEIIEWEKSLGSYRWIGKRTLLESALRTRFEDRKAHIKELKKALDSGITEYQQLDSDYIDDLLNDKQPTYRAQDPSGWDYGLFKTNYSLLLDFLEKSNETLEIVSEETRLDWEPQFSTAPAPYKVYNIPWQKRKDFNLSGTGEAITLQVGRFNDYNMAQTVADDIKNAKEQRTKSLAITNINELFLVGEIDAPSFNIDVDGIKSSGVYLNG